MDANLCLEDRVNAFDRFGLPGQPKFMHMGTSELIDDLWNEVQWLRFQMENLNRAASLRKNGMMWLALDHNAQKATRTAKQQNSMRRIAPVPSSLDKGQKSGKKVL